MSLREAIEGPAVGVGVGRAEVQLAPRALADERMPRGGTMDLLLVTKAVRRLAHRSRSDPV